MPKPEWPFNLNNTPYTEGIIACWMHWVLVEGLIKDISPSRAHLSPTNLTYGSHAEHGSHGIFDGSTSYARADTRTQFLQMFDQGTILAICNPQSFSTSQHVIYARGLDHQGAKSEEAGVSLMSTRDSGDRRMEGRAQFYDSDDSLLEVVNRQIVADRNNWQKVLFRFSMSRAAVADRADIIIDGKGSSNKTNDTSSDFDEVNYDPAMKSILGAGFDNSHTGLTKFWEGQIGSLVLWNRYLRDDEVNAIMNDPYAALLSNNAGDSVYSTGKKPLRSTQGVERTKIRNLKGFALDLPWFPSTYGEGLVLGANQEVTLGYNLFEEIASRPDAWAAVSEAVSNGLIAVAACGSDPYEYSVLKDQPFPEYNENACAVAFGSSSSSVAIAAESGIETRYSEESSSSTGGWHTWSTGEIGEEI